MKRYVQARTPQMGYEPVDVFRNGMPTLRTPPCFLQLTIHQIPLQLLD